MTSRSTRRKDNMGSPIMLQAGGPARTIHAAGAPAGSQLSPGVLSATIQPPAGVPASPAPFTVAIGVDKKSVVISSPAGTAPCVGWKVLLTWTHTNPGIAPHTTAVPVTVEAGAATGLDWTVS
jgi:hypothetical protein